MMIDTLNHDADAFQFTYGAIEEILEPIFEYYPDDPSKGSPFNTGDDLFGLNRAYKRAAALYGDIFFQAPRRHFLRETPKDWGEPSWNFLYLEPKPGAEARFGGRYTVHFAARFAWHARKAVQN